MQLLAEENRSRYTQMVKQISQAKEAFIEGKTWLERGQAAFDQRNYEETVSALEKALAATREGGKRVEIQVMLDKARPLAERQRQQREARQRGEALFRTGEYEKARQELAQGGDVGDYLNAARAGALLRSAQHNWKEDVETAQMDLEDAIRLGQSNSLAEREGIVEDARRLLQRIEKQREDREKVQADLNAARQALRQGKLDDALERTKAVLERDPANSEAKALEMLVQAQIALEKRDYDEAHANVTTVLESVLPGYPDAQALLKLIESGRQANEALVRAESLARGSEFQQARQALKQAIDLKADPSRLKAVQEAIAELERRWEIKTIDPIRALFRDGDYAEALSRCHQALGRGASPDFRVVLENLQTDIVNRWAEKGIEQARENLGQATSEEAFDAVVGNLDQLAALKPSPDPPLVREIERLRRRAQMLKQVDALISEARSHIGRGQWEQAIDSLLEARKDAPAYQPVVDTTNDLLDRLSSLARARLAEERFDDGIALCDLALQVSSRDDIVALREEVLHTHDARLAKLVHLAGSALDSWDLEEATRVLQRGLNIAPEHRELLQLHPRLQQMYDMASQLKEAMERGWSALKIRDYQAARLAFVQVLDAAPDFREAERWRDYADNMARAIRTIQEEEILALGVRYLEAAEGLLRIGRGERLPSILGGQTRLRKERCLAVHEAYRYSISVRQEMGKTIRVFVSSTWRDLRGEREAVEAALHRMKSTTFSGMEYFGSRPETPKEVCLTEVARSHVYVGIFAHRYGSLDKETGLSMTELEYREAQECDIPCLIYLMDKSVHVLLDNFERDREKAARLEALKRELLDRHTVSFFQNPDNLATRVLADLHNLLADMEVMRL